MADDDFGISMAWTKKEIVKRYEELLETYREQVRLTEAVEQQRTEAEKRADAQAMTHAEEVGSVDAAEALTMLRATINSNLLDWSERLESQSRRLASLDRAIEIKEQRLAELDDLGTAVDGLN